MARELTVEDIDDFDSFLQPYLEHIGDPPTNFKRFKQRLQSGISASSRYVIGAYDDSGEALGILIHNPETHRLSLILAKSVFKVEKELFDEMFSKFSETSPTLIFESGYPTPWI